MSGKETLFITTDAVGGVWSYSLALARGVAEAGQPCILAVLGPPPDAAQTAEVSRIAGCSLLHPGLPLEWTLTGRDALDPLLDLLMATAARSGAASCHLHAPALACRRWPMRTVAVAHSCMATWWDAVHGGTPPDEIAWHAAATQGGLAGADAVVAPSAAFASALQRVYRIKRPLHVVHNGLPQPAAQTAEREPFVLAAGRLWDPAKNMAVLDAAAAQVPYPLLAAGPLAQPGGADVRFDALQALGRLESGPLGMAMARAAIFASPSLYEPFGLAVLEAAQRGTPLLLADIPTFRELWDGAAVFVPASDAQAWAAAIRSLMDDPAQRRELGAAALAASRSYTQDATVTGTRRIHQALATRALRAA